MTDPVSTSQESAELSLPNSTAPQSSWPAGIACVSYFGITAIILNAYSLLHWPIIRDHYSSLEDPLKSDLFRLLGHLEVYHLTAVLSVLFGVWTFRGHPRWLRWVCLPVSILSLVMFVIVM